MTDSLDPVRARELALKFLPHQYRHMHRQLVGDLGKTPPPAPPAWTGTDPGWGPYPWAETAGGVGCLTTNPDTRTAIFLSTVYPQYTAAAGVEIDLDVTQFGVPIGAKMAFIGGLAIITGGQDLGENNVTIAVGPRGAVDPAAYIGQALNPAIYGDGVRSMGGFWAPLTPDPATGHPILAWAWGRGSVPGEWPSGPLDPNGAYYGWNLCIQGYAK